jgi:hypothetical protein
MLFLSPIRFFFYHFLSSSISLSSILSTFRLHSVFLPVPFSPSLLSLISLHSFHMCSILSLSSHSTFWTFFLLLPSNTCFLSPPSSSFSISPRSFLSFSLISLDPFHMCSILFFSLSSHSTLCTFFLLLSSNTCFHSPPSHI